MSIKRIKELRDQRNTLAGEIRNLDEKHGSNWQPEHQTVYDTNMATIERIDAQVKRLQSIEDLAAEQAFENRGGGTQRGPLGADAPDNERRRAVHDKWLRGGDNALSAEDWQVVRNTMSTTTPAEGGYTVQSEVAPEVIKAMKAASGMREAATTFSTSTGAPLSWPTNDDTAQTGELVAENATAADQDTAFGTVSLNTFKFSSKTFAIPIELVQDSQVDIAALVIELSGTRLGRVINTYCTTGTGSGQPRGIVVASAAGKVGASGQTATVLYDDLVDLEHSVNRAYRNAPGAGFMMNDNSLKIVRKIKDTTGRPIFVPGYDQGVPGGAPATLLARPIYINDDMADMAASAKSILFGARKNYRIRDAMQVTLFRFTDSAFTKKGQVGFLAWMRAGGNLIDVSGATVKHYQNAAS